MGEIGVKQGGKGGGGDGVKYGELGAKKNCGARVEEIREVGLLFLQHGDLFIACWCNRFLASRHGLGRAFQEQEQQQHKATHC